MAPGDGQGLLHAAALFFGGVRIGSGEGGGSGVVVQFVEGQDELPHDMAYQGQQERGAVATEEPRHPATGTVVVEQENLFGGKAQGIGGAGGGPFPQAVDRLPRQEEILDQHGQSAGSGDPAAASFLRQVVAEKLFQFHPLQQVVEDRQGTKAVGPQGAAGRTGDASRSCRNDTGARRLFSFGHEGLLEQEGRRADRRPCAMRGDAPTSVVLLKEMSRGYETSSDEKHGDDLRRFSLDPPRAGDEVQRGLVRRHSAPFADFHNAQKGSCVYFQKPRGAGG